MQFFRIGRPKIEERIAYIRAYRAARDQADVDRALERLRRDTASGANVMPAILNAVDARVTIGEVGEAFREAIGFRLRQ
jgi:methylmalonyl-CoA mutase N-terminal domain/subunit